MLEFTFRKHFQLPRQQITKMANVEGSGQLRNKKRGLAPITQQSTTENNNIEAQPARREANKKTISNDVSSARSALDDGEDEREPTPRRRRKRSPSQGKDTQLAETPASQSVPVVPKKKKKKPKPDEGDVISGQISHPVPISQNQQESQGSKTSLITTSESPRKKKGKKKKKTKRAVNDADEFAESPWADDLRTMKDDIIVGDGQVEGEEEKGKGEKEKPIISFISAPVLRSQPLDKIFVETSNKFKGQKKSTLMKQRTEEIRPVEPVGVTRKTTIDFAVSTHKIFRVMTLFLHGLTAGVALWQLVIVFLLSSFPSDDFLEHYYKLSLPLQSSYYFLLVICTVSACDRFDIGNPTPRFVLQALTLQNGAVSIVLYLVALILNIVVIRFDDRMYLFKEYADLYSDSNVKSSDISTFKGINTARSALIILAWFVLSITPKADRLGKNLQSGETGLEDGHEMGGVSAA